MKRYKPKTPYNVPIKLLIPTEKNVKGTIKKVWPALEDAPMIFGSFRTFGGTEMTNNDVYVVVDTGTVETWYRPDIKSNCRLHFLETGDVYEVVGAPEDIYMRHQYMRMRVQKVKGGA